MKKTKKLIKETWFLEMKKLIRIMKLTCFLLIFFMTCILANNNYSQTKLLNVKMEEQTLKEILSEIENQSEFYFMYSSKLIDVNRKVTVNFENQKIDQVLNSLFAGTDINYVIKDRIIVLASSVLTDDEIPVIMQQQSVSDKVTDSDEKPAVMQQQSLSVSGNVIDVDGEPIPGVSIIIKGTAKGTITDTYGNYSLSDISEKAILVFSFVGMLTQEIVVGNQTIINATMEQDIVGLEEVVVIGYGTAKKSDLTGAVVRADLTTMENSPNVNIIQSIKGVVPGLNIGVATTAGEDPTIQIRGQKSITSTAGAVGPLIVLDGIIYRGRLTDINPNDIGSIDVLKDASSAAIYGSQSANGVILITTKTATKLSKPIIEYSTQFAIQRLISNKMQRLDDEGFVQQMKDVFIGESRMGDDLLQENPDFDVTTKFKDIVVTEGYYAGTNTDWYSLLSNPHPYIQNHNISVRGNNELANYFMSFGYTDQKNIVKNDNYKRYSFRINLDTKVTDWLKLGTQTYYNISDYSGTNTTFGALCQIPAQITPYNADGSLVERTYLGGLNPLLSIDNPNVDVRNVLSGTFYSEISIPWIKGLSYRVNYSRYAENYKNYTFDPYFENNQGSGSKKISNTLSSTFDNIVTYKREFDKHSVNMTLVYGVEKREYETTTATARNFTNMTLIYNKLDVGQADLQKALSGAWKESSLYSMARMVYSFNDRYMFTGTFRRDGFSGFTEKNKFGIFPSLGLGWRLSEEDFFKNSLSFVDNFKLRISYGQGGNRTAERYSSLASISTYEDAASTIVGGYLYGDGATGQLSQAIATMANSSLKWETTTSTNFGVDFSVLKGRVYGNYEFYTSKTKDLLYDVSTPQINGTYNTNVATNIGQLQNTGHEVSITGVPVRNHDFEWSITGNFSINKNKVITVIGLDVDNDGKEDDLLSASPYPIFIGEPLNPVYDYKIIGMWQVEDYRAGIIPTGFTYGVYKIEDINNDGQFSADSDRVILGNRDPLFRFSIQNNISYKGFELSIFINAIQGGKDHYLGQPAADLLIPDHLQNWSWFEFDYWTPENPDAKYRQLGSYNNVAGAGFSPYVSRSFIRLQELSLSYSFSSKLLSKAKISKAIIYITGTNLFTITKWDGWDPEANQGLTYNLKKSTDKTNEYNGYPTMKSYSVGMNFEF